MEISQNNEVPYCAHTKMTYKTLNKMYYFKVKLGANICVLYSVVKLGHVRNNGLFHTRPLADTGLRLGVFTFFLSFKPCYLFAFYLQYY